MSKSGGVASRHHMNQLLRQFAENHNQWREQGAPSGGVSKVFDDARRGIPPPKAAFSASQDRGDRLMYRV